MGWMVVWWSSYSCEVSIAVVVSAQVRSKVEVERLLAAWGTDDSLVVRQYEAVST
jgi:hypothetical protein